MQKTFIYKQAVGLEICAEVFWDESKSSPRPVVVPIHGGALMGGMRLKELDRLGQHFVDAGYAGVQY